VVENFREGSFGKPGRKEEADKNRCGSNLRAVSRTQQVTSLVRILTTKDILSLFHPLSTITTYFLKIHLVN
jgi:hypothetical protein